MPHSAQTSPPWPTAQVVRGPARVLAMRAMLVELCMRSGQAGAMDSLELFLGLPSSRKLKTVPHLVLVDLRTGVDAGAATADDVAGAVLVHEFELAGQGTDVFATHDAVCERSVIAPSEIRMQVAEIAFQVLLSCGAVAVRVSFEGDGGAARQAWVGETPPCWMATKRLTVPWHLALEQTLEGTLATLGRHTRRNLRYYRRLAEADFGARFVPCVAMAREEFLEANRLSTNPVSDSLAGWRYDAMGRLEARSSRQRFFAGVKAADGRWLSLVGGCRADGVAEVDWQMNRSGLPRHSLSTVMRNYLMEAEIGRGTKRLHFKGGTSHPMRRSFAQREAVDLMVLRRCIRGWVLRQLSQRKAPAWKMPMTWHDPDLIWIRR